MTDDTITRARAALARLAEAERGATPGPWECSYGGYIGTAGTASGPHVLDGYEFDIDDADAAAIVALRNAAPALLALAEAATAHVARAAEKHGITSPDDCYEPTMADLWRAVAALADAPGEVQP